MDHAHELSSASKGIVMVAALPTVTAGVLPELVASFARIHPGNQLQVLDVVAERVREAVLKREVDFGIGTTQARDAQLGSMLLFRDRLVLFVPRGHALARQTAITLRDITAYDLILPTRECSMWENVEAIARREQLALRTRYETNFMPTALGFVRAGLGVAILPDSAAGPGAAGYVAESMRKQWPGAPHATEIPFVFDTVAAKYGKELAPNDERIAQAMLSYWVAFAKTGDPSTGNSPGWPRYTPATDMIMDFTTEGPVAEADPWKARLDVTASYVTTSAPPPMPVMAPAGKGASRP